MLRFLNPQSENRIGVLWVDSDGDQGRTRGFAPTVCGVRRRGAVGPYRTTTVMGGRRVMRWIIYRSAASSNFGNPEPSPGPSPLRTKERESERCGEGLRSYTCPSHDSNKYERIGGTRQGHPERRGRSRGLCDGEEQVACRSGRGVAR